MKHSAHYVASLDCEVDAKIIHAVLAMNNIPGITTISSCQGDPGIIEIGRGAYGHIAFKVKGGWQDLCQFCFEDLGQLFSEFLDDEIRVDIFANSKPYAWLNFRHELIELITGRLRGWKQ